MRLTDEQRKIVEDNYGLVYGVMEKYNLMGDDEWESLFSLELCKAVYYHNPKISELSTYFYNRCKFLRLKTLDFTRRNIRCNIGVDESLVFLDNEDFQHISLMENDDDEDYLFQQLLDQFPNDKELLTLKYEGYSQSEISKMLDISQATISRRLNNIKIEWEDKED